jgi:N utilization substance protein B
MAARSKARHRALDILFEADLRNRPALDVLADMRARRTAEGMPPLNAYTAELVEGVVEHQLDIDAQLATYAIGWSLDRMPSVDRNVLRIGAFEVLYSDTVPGAVAVNEAVELVKQFSTDESPRFVNGLLGRLLQLRDRP